MLKSVIIQDFFSFKGRKEIKLRDGVNLLLGINGSGKSSFIKALSVLTEGVASEGGLTSLIQGKWGGYKEIANCNGEREVPFVELTYVFDYNKLNKINEDAKFTSDLYYRITIHPLGSTSYILEESIYTEHKTKCESQFKYLEFYNGNGKISTRDDKGKISFLAYTSDNISGQELVLRQINDPVHYLPISTLRKAIESMSVYNNFNVEEGSALRKPSEYSTYKRLKKDGSNLFQILANLQLEHSFDYTRLEDTFKNVNPNFKRILIANPNGQLYLYLEENNFKHTISVLHISDGSLRFLLLESIFLNPLRGSLTAIDEPEKGLHPDMIRSVANMINQAAKQTQLIIATHSPHLLNQFELEDILVFEKDNENSTIVNTISEDDFPDWEGDFLPGQMWLLGQIGGKRW